MEQEFKISKQSKRFFLLSAFFWFLLLISFVISEFQTWQDPESTFFMKYVLYPLAICVPILAMIVDLATAFFTKIMINKDHIKFQTFGVTIVANWSRVIAVEDFGMIKKIEGISVLKSSVKKNIFVLVRRPNIPIQYFGEDWRQTKLGQQIRRYAPHLFEQKT